MCQLLGMNCNTPTDIQFSFQGFSRRGGLTDHHADGWGIAFFEHSGVRVFLDDMPSAHSPVAAFVQAYPIKSENVIAHIRKATQGAVNLANVHPFQREMWGRYWIFAHNGNLENFTPPAGRFYQPVGQTDSEAAFCLLLETLRSRFDAMPALDDFCQVVAEVTATIRQHGIFNFMLSNGDFLLAHCSTKLHYLVRQAPFAEAHLLDEDMSIDFNQVTTPNDRVAVIATLPLTDNETWTAFAEGELMLFRDGLPTTIAVPMPNGRDKIATNS